VDAGADRALARRIGVALDGLAPADLERLSVEARRRLRSSGAGSRPVRALDPLPVVIDAGTWAHIEAGVVQRVRLLEAVLADVYGPQRTVATGILPPEIAFGSPSLLPEPARPGGRWLTYAATDVGFGADGTPVVLGDRTGHVSGLGTALENRVVTAALHADLFTGSDVRPLTPLLDGLLGALGDLATRTDSAGRVVVLSPPRSDPAHESAAYLARTLGYTLAEGADLTVRRGALFLRAIGGLEPVQVVFRLVADAEADPLEINPSGPAGTPALLAVARKGAVTVVNPLGAGWAGRRVLGPFLPALAEALLDEPLLLDAPPAWWCGGPDRAAVLDHLHQLVLYDVAGVLPVDGRTLSQAGLEALAAEVEARPDAWVARQPVELATVAGVVDGRRVPTTAVTRVFSAITADGPVVGSGGLTRQEGGHGPDAPSKDTWVLAPQASDAGGAAAGPAGSGRSPLALVTARAQVDLAASLPVRAGEALFWLGRMAERAETLVRVARVVAEAPHLAGPARALGTLASAAPDHPGGRDLARAALLDGLLATGLRASVASLAGNAAAVDELLPAELYTAVRDAVETALALDSTAPELDLGGLDALLRSLAAAAGLAQEALVRGPGWRLLDAGRRVERALATVTLLQSLGPEPDAELLDAMLTAAISLIAYRRSYRTEPELTTVHQFLVDNAANPRSIRFQLDCLADDLDLLAVGPRRPARIALMRKAEGLRSLLHDLSALRRGFDELARQIELEYVAQVPLTRMQTGTRS
jgi:uncharacterized circularly permuted ATP-grasp superfamily protein/uncharacterized alpha-E superfamily protein